MGQPVTASAAGKVIFSGTGIRGLGKLIIIKHNDAFLSVYAHNSELLVKEDQTVAKQVPTASDPHRKSISMKIGLS